MAQNKTPRDKALNKHSMDKQGTDTPTNGNADPYMMRRPGRPKRSEATQTGSTAKTGADQTGAGPRRGSKAKGEEPAEMASGSSAGGSLRFEMRLPPAMVDDLELMRKQTGVTFSEYIRRAILRALAEDKKHWT